MVATDTHKGLKTPTSVIRAGEGAFAPIPETDLYCSDEMDGEDEAVAMFTVRAGWSRWYCG